MFSPSEIQPNSNALAKLPVDIRKVVYSQMPPENLQKSLEQDIELSMTDRNDIWHQKYRIHFKKYYEQAKKQPENWENKFWKTYKEQYENVDENAKIIFSLAKENPEYLKLEDPKRLFLAIQSHLENKSSKGPDTNFDIDGKTPLDYFDYSGNQDMCDFLYSVVIQYYEENSDKDKNFPLWAILFHQDLKIIQALYVSGAFKDTFPLHVAAQAGRLDNLKYIFGKSSTPNKQDKRGMSPLALAFANNRLSAVEFLIQQESIDLNLKSGELDDSMDRMLTNSGITVLHWAVREGHFALAEQLLKRNADASIKIDTGFIPFHFAIFQSQKMAELLIHHHEANNTTNLLDTPDDFGITPLIIAIKENPEIAKKLLNMNIDVNIHTVIQGHSNENLNGMTLLHEAASQSDSEILKILLSKGADSKAKTKASESIPLHFALTTTLENVQILLKANPDSLNQENAEGHTPLIIAVKNSSLVTVEYLLEQEGINLNAVNKYGLSALYYAIMQDDKSMIDMLTSKGATLNLNTGNFTRLIITAATNGHTAVLRYLLNEKPSEINVADDNGTTALYCAAYFGQANAVALLLEKGADPNVMNKHKMFPIHVATQKANLDIIKMLSLKDPNQLNLSNPNNITPLICATMNGNFDVVQYLLNSGQVDPNCQILGVAPPQDHFNGKTALHFAAEQGCTKIVSLLLENGANPELASEDKELPIHSASKSGHIEIVTLIKNNLLDKEDKSHQKTMFWQNKYDLDLRKQCFPEFMNQMTKLINETNSRSDGLFKSPKRYTALVNLMRDLTKLEGEVRTNQNISPLQEAYMMIGLTTECYNKIVADDASEFMSTPSITTQNLLTIIKNLCKETGTKIEITKNNHISKILSVDNYTIVYEDRNPGTQLTGS